MRILINAQKKSPGIVPELAWLLSRKNCYVPKYKARSERCQHKSLNFLIFHAEGFCVFGKILSFIIRKDYKKGYTVC
jgi:hypothetical protein